MITIQTPAGPLRKGDVCLYFPFTGPAREVRVDAISDDIKNGRPGFSGETSEGSVWGYADQITEVYPS